jgi:hypothetical protein
MKEAKLVDRHTVTQSCVVASRPSELPSWATKTARLGPKRGKAVAEGVDSHSQASSRIYGYQVFGTNSKFQAVSGNGWDSCHTFSNGPNPRQMR